MQILSSSTFVYIFLFGLGAIFASFITVITERIHTGQSWFQGRSRCNSCRRTLTGVDLIPILSWVVFLGRCRTCRSRVPIVYAIGEAILGTLFAVSYVRYGLTPLLLLVLVFLSTLFFVVLYDIRHTIVPYWSWSVIIVLGALISFFTSASLYSFGTSVLTSALIALGFYLLYFFSKGRAMGLGDTPMAFGLALMAGVNALSGVLFSFWIGAVIGIAILVMRRGGPTMGIEVPFVPFLAAGFLLALFTQWNVLLF